MSGTRPLARDVPVRGPHSSHIISDVGVEEHRISEPRDHTDGSDEPTGSTPACHRSILPDNTEQSTVSCRGRATSTLSHRASVEPLAPPGIGVTARRPRAHCRCGQVAKTLLTSPDSPGQMLGFVPERQSRRARLARPKPLLVARAITLGESSERVWLGFESSCRPRVAGHGRRGIGSVHVEVRPAPRPDPAWSPQSEANRSSAGVGRQSRGSRCTEICCRTLRFWTASLRRSSVPQFARAGD
jgi:hypothetical protein